ncbi:hypothetical protein AC578_4994 [Pseudocercospora eumusae]|uniref:Vacuolar sorting protein Vps3844 C-terminal domain-containing protein n=1 Tax=Pseudocercospora eumusae TaxID=321146 RepID=A0A139H950_9PEZI|nr:hypothetical protein AC578_4994 [Pseudocercospora eumusae]
MSYSSSTIASVVTDISPATTTPPTMKLTTTGIISALCWSARIASASASTAHILTYDPQPQYSQPSSTTTLSPVPARLLLAQRAGVEDYHRADIARDEVIDAINHYGVRHRMFTERRDGPRRALILVEGVEGNELDSFRSAYTSVQVSPAPAAHASKALFIDLVKQSDPRPFAALSDEALLANIKETNNVVVNGDIFYLADSLADASAMFQKLANSNEWSITALISPPVDRFTKQGKQEKFQWGTYEMPQSQTKAKRDRLPKEEPLTETHSFKPVHSSSASVSSFANNTTPLRGILPACFTSQSACESATRNCTGHGQCSKKYHDPDSLAPGGSTGLDCWSCQCKSTKSSDGKKTTVWGGPACQKKDVSVEFWLIALFTVALVSLIGFAVGTLFSMGSEELPSVIGAGVSGPTARNYHALLSKQQLHPSIEPSSGIASTILLAASTTVKQLQDIKMQDMSLNNYWRLRGPGDYLLPSCFRKALADAGYKPRTKQPAFYLYRVQKNLPCYEKCTVKELRKFATDRAAHEKPTKAGRAALTDALLTADESISFHRFMDLPPELRNNIYELYFADFCALRTPSQPPIARTSHQVRDEALSTFYACCKFEITLVDNADGHFIFSAHSMSFLNGLRVTDVGWLSNLCFELTPRDQIKLVKNKDDKYTIALEERVSLWGDGLPSRYPGAQKRLDDYFQDQKLSTGEKKLELGHIWKIRNILEHRD